MPSNQQETGHGNQGATKPVNLAVLFVCVHNAGRSQMAAALYNLLAKEAGLDSSADSAGTSPSAAVNPIAIEAMKEVGLDVSAAVPRQLTADLAASADRIITMGCSVDSEQCPAGAYISEDWGLDDPAGRGLEDVRRIRDEIKSRVLGLLDH